MATYVPGSQTYGREFQPFTPDYKFLSSVLQTRQDRYDTNYKQLSDLYSRVVYADLSRDDTTATRDQYAEKLSPKIQQLSGMDLSMRQNVDAAKGLFKPFYDDDLVVKDIVYTKAFRKAAEEAQRLKNSNNLDDVTRYWDTGMEYLGFQMENFKNAGKEEALRLGLPEYVENVNLSKMANEILQEAGFEDVEVTIPDDKGYWLITQKNGDQQVPGLYNYLLNNLLEDPRVIDAYRVSGYVEAEKFARNEMAAGRASTSLEGRTAWARQKLDFLTAGFGKANDILKKQFEQAMSAKENWEGYKRDKGIIPGSREEKAMTDALEEFDKVGGAIERNERSLQTIAGLDESQDLVDKTFNLLMNYNLSSDILGAAEAYSMRDFSRTVEVNPYKKMEVQHAYDLAKIQQNHLNKLAQIKFKAQVDPENAATGLTNLVDKIFPGMTGPGMQATQFESVDDAMARNTEDAAAFAAVTLQEQVGFITEIDKLSKLGKSLKNSNINRMTITLSDGTDFTGSYDQVREQLLMTDENGRYVNASAIGTLYRKSKLDFESLPNTNPTALEHESFLTASSSLDNITARESLSLQYDKTYNQVLLDNFERALEITEADGIKELRENFQAGAPRIIQNTPSGPQLLSEDEYVVAMTNMIKNGQIANKDIEDYMVTVFPGSTYGEGAISRGINPTVTARRVLDEEAIEEAARKMYNEQYAILNSTIDESFAMNYTGGQGMQPFSADAYFRGVSLGDMTASDLFTYRGYQDSFSLSRMNNPSSVSMLANLVRQYNETSPAERIIIPATESAVSPFSLSDESTMEDADRRAAAYIFDQVLLQTKNAMLNPEAAKSKNFMYDITYSPVINMDGETFAGYTIKLPKEVVEEFADAPDARGRIIRELSSETIPEFTELTMLVPEDKDLNPRSAGNYNFSAVDTQINMSSDNAYDYNVFDDTAGSFKVFQDNGIYYTTAELLTVDPKTGLYVNQGVIPATPIVDDQGNYVGKANLDAHVAHKRRVLEERHKQNVQNHNFWKTQNGIK